MCEVDDLYECFRELLHEVPEAENALLAWRREQSLRSARQRARDRRIEILVKCYGGLPDPDDVDPRNA